jgi:hypothetical protein
MTWDFPDEQLERMPALRRWFAAEGIRDVEEEGYAGVEDPHDASLLMLVPQWFTDATVLSDEFRDDKKCERCGLTTRRIRRDAKLELDRNPGEGPLLTYAREASALVMPASDLELLHAAGLDRGLGILPVNSPGVPHVALFGDVALGEPVAPFGSTGEPCPECGRRARRTESGLPAPGLPRYSYYWLFERPVGEPQWTWNVIHGQIMPMVTPDVARWFYERDPTMQFERRGWSPDELEQAFLPEQYR